MDGSYGNIFPTTRSMSPSIPASSGGDAYKVNVSRQKTRKWANFKPQNYDGDDWGADYDNDDDDEPETPPLPTPKPLGPRQPAQPSPTARNFQPPGIPPLQTQTHPPVAPSGLARPVQPVGGFSHPSGPASAGGVLERRGTGQTMSPQSNVPGSAVTASSVYSNRPGYAQPISSPTSLHNAPVPESSVPGPATANAALRFPGRQGSMNPYEAANSPGASQPGSRAAESPKPRIEGRSESPASARSMASPVFNKPLPFVRPADIYRKLEEEKEKERRSLESGRGSLDLTTNPQSEAVLQKPAGGPATAAPEQPTPSNARVPATRPGLAPVEERKSEYGIEGLIASYGYEGRNAPVPPVTVEADKWKNRPESVESTEPSSEGKEIRRFSSSPVLPDFTRLSSFGDGLFSGSSNFLSEAGKDKLTANSPSLTTQTMTVPDTTRVPTPTQAMHPPQPRVSAPGPRDPSPTPPVTAPEPESRTITPTPAAAGVSLSDAGAGQSPARDALPQGDGASESTAAGSAPQMTTRSTSPPNEPNQSVGPSSPQGDSAAASSVADSAHPKPAADVPPKSAPEPERAPLFRPSLPGGWVSETPTLPDDSKADADTRPPAQTLSSTREVDDNKIEDSPEAREQTPTAEQPPAVRAAREASPAKREPLPTSRSASPYSVPPLRTASPAVSTAVQTPPSESTVTSQERDSRERTPEGSPPVEAKDTSSEPETAGTRDITPIAPLNPRRDQPPASSPEEPLQPPPSFDPGPTPDATESPLKESDVLSQEIIQSLSPQPPAAAFTNTVGANTGAYVAAAGAGRESSYLGDVYGDYWAATDETLDTNLVVPSAKGEVPKETEKTLPPSDQVPPKAPEVQPAASHSMAVISTPDVSAATAAKPAGLLRKRFSWEAPDEEVHVERTPVRSPEPSVAPASAEKQVVVASQTSPKNAVSELPAGPVPGANAGPQSNAVSELPADQASQAKSQKSNLATEGPVELPSPTSVSTGERTGTSGEAPRLSIADEKALLHGPSKPLEEHPALAGVKSPSVQAPAVAPAPRIPVKADAINLLAFRVIMEMPTPGERINSYKETRNNFAMIDTGLDEWLKAMASRHPEHTGTDWSAPRLPSSSGQHGSQISGHGSPTGTFPAQGIRPAGTIPMPPPSHHAPAGFVHSSNQVGAKSKELLKVAGKAGKGLLSKGRNKLRGTHA